MSGAGAEMAVKGWNGSVVPRAGWLSLQFKENGRWKMRAAGLPDTPEGRAQAEQLLEEVVRTLRAREKLATGQTLRAYAQGWMDARKGSSAGDDRQRLKDHVLPVLGDKPFPAVTAGDVRKLVADLAGKASRKGGTLAPRTIRNVYGVLQAMCTDAVIDGVIPASPCVLRAQHLPQARDKVAGWRDTAIFSLEEVLQLLTDARLPQDRRTFYALLFLGCTRFGEAAELRWSDYDPGAQPLGKLRVLRSYSTRLGEVKGTKAERPRNVPVVQLLAAMLAEWKLSGWPALRGGKPEPGDLIVPSRKGVQRSANHMLKKFHQDLARLKSEALPAGLRLRRQHDARRTWFSLVLAAGANETHARWTAWGPPPALWADYTSMPWTTLCAVGERLHDAIRAAQAAAERRRA